MRERRQCPGEERRVAKYEQIEKKINFIDNYLGAGLSWLNLNRMCSTSAGHDGVWTYHQPPETPARAQDTQDQKLGGSFSESGSNDRPPLQIRFTGLVL